MTSCRIIVCSSSVWVSSLFASHSLSVRCLCWDACSGQEGIPARLNPSQIFNVYIATIQ